ncbi:MAG TPA: hypothetical protein EYG83_08620 [Sulfurospirillum arcachonense]|nr:hypothetical protein [Sulfurospirillum arcachonense]
MKKATKFSEIQDATFYNMAIDNEHPFYTDFSNLRKNFSEKKLYRMLNIQDNNECQPLSSFVKIFLRGHRGTGKTSELLSLQKKIKNTGCYFVVFSDLSDGSLDINNIEFVDVMLLLLEKFMNELENSGATVSSDILEPFYDWFNERITEVNSTIDASATIGVELEGGVSIPFFSKLLAKTTAKLGSSSQTKESIRNVFKPRVSDFLLKFNELTLFIKKEFMKLNKYDDILFILDGFEKIGHLDNRKKVIIDDANLFNRIEANMIITLPIELFEHTHTLTNFAKVISFPLISLEKEESKIKLKEFILRRVDESLFDHNDVLDKIIVYGAGSPRETLRLIQQAYIEAENELIDLESVEKAIVSMGNQMARYLEDKEISVLKQILNKNDVPFDDTVANLLVEKILLEYEKDNPCINPLVKENKKLQRMLSA